MLPILDLVGPRDSPGVGHWFALSINLKAKRFEVLDSLRKEGDAGLADTCKMLTDRIKALWKVGFAKKDTTLQSIHDFRLTYIPLPSQTNL